MGKNEPMKTIEYRAEDQKKRLSPTYQLENYVVSLTRSTVSIINGVLFVGGSVAFWPDFGSNGVILGNWFFRMGSSFTLLSLIWAFYRSFKPSNQTRKEILSLKIFYIQYMLGAIGFLVGGAYFLIEDGTIGAIGWMVGSVFFWTGSLTLLVM